MRLVVVVGFVVVVVLVAEVVLPVVEAVRPVALLVVEAVVLGFVVVVTFFVVEVVVFGLVVAGAAALSVSGMDCREWKFYGFLPREKKDLREALLRIPRETRIGIVHESPYRVLSLMEQLAEVLPDCRVSVSCDLTKMHELTLRVGSKRASALSIATRE